MDRPVRRVEGEDQLRASTARAAAGQVDRYLPHLHRRRAEGCHDATILYAEITALGYRGSLRTIYRYVQPLHSATLPRPSPRHP